MVFFNSVRSIRYGAGKNRTGSKNKIFGQFGLCKIRGFPFGFSNSANHFGLPRPSIKYAHVLQACGPKKAEVRLADTSAKTNANSNADATISVNTANDATSPDTQT